MNDDSRASDEAGHDAATPVPVLGSTDDGDALVITLSDSPGAAQAAQEPRAEEGAPVPPPLDQGMSPRMRRLMADWDAVRTEFSGHPLVTVEPLGPAPADKYKVTYRLLGLALDGDQPVRVAYHECEIHLPVGYPREQPLVLPLTPIFHPNVLDRYCIADHWAAGEGLMDVISRLARIIQYQSFNTKSPLNSRAARWAEENPDLFPIGDEQLGRGELDISFGSADA